MQPRHLCTFVKQTRLVGFGKHGVNNRVDLASSAGPLVGVLAPITLWRRRLHRRERPGRGAGSTLISWCCHNSKHPAPPSYDKPQLSDLSTGSHHEQCAATSSSAHSVHVQRATRQSTPSPTHPPPAMPHWRLPPSKQTQLGRSSLCTHLM